MDGTIYALHCCSGLSMKARNMQVRIMLQLLYSVSVCFHNIKLGGSLHVSQQLGTHSMQNALCVVKTFQGDTSKGADVLKSLLAF